MVINVAIVEDTPSEYQVLESYLNSIANNKHSFNISAYTSAEDFLKEFRRGRFQLIFLDIQLPKMDGLSCARRLRNSDEDVVVVFITSMAQFAINGYEVNAKDYIVKPLLYDQFLRKMKRILPMVRQNTANFISINNSSENPEVISVDDLMFVEVFGHKLIYHCKKGDFEANGTISEAEEKLKPFKFLRCNRHTVVNPRYIEHVKGTVLEIHGAEVTISAPRKAEFLKELNNWIGGR